MALTNLDKETLYLKCSRLKDEFSTWGKSGKIVINDLGQKEIRQDVITVCNELIDLIDQLPEFEKALEGMKLIKEFRNFASNI